MLVIDRLNPETAPAALEAAQSGLRVLSQIDTVFRGADVVDALADLGVRREHLAGVHWVIAVRRLAALCPRCKQLAATRPEQWAELQRRYPDIIARCPQLIRREGTTFFRATGCTDCAHTGRQGDVAAFDIFRSVGDGQVPHGQASLLPLEEYVLCLAASGHIPLDDVLRLETEQVRHAYTLLTTCEWALSQAKATLERKLIELEASNRVLKQRTEALISLQALGQALLNAVGVNELANRVCHHTCELCGADRAILYYLASEDNADVLAASGWAPARVPQHVSAALVFQPQADTRTEPVPFNGWPPGIGPRHPDVEGAVLRAGLRVPLIAQPRPVWVMIVHTTRKASFTPGEVALLQTFAQQGALAIQRARLLEELQGKIDELEAAQAELLKKERMEQEMELARLVQQSFLPRSFPHVAGYEFAVRNEPARHVGGDFYDVIRLDDDHFGVVSADVSGKGMPASLYMALTRCLLLAEARRERSPRAVLTNVNQLLPELGTLDMFVTTVYGVVERATRRLTYVRAGHDHPLLQRQGTAHELGGQGAVLGILDEDDLRLSEEQLALVPGDRLVLYTDGLTDAVGVDGHPFGCGRFKALLESRAALSSADLCNAVFAELTAYRGSTEQYDDLTLLVVEVS